MQIRELKDKNALVLTKHFFYFRISLTLKKLQNE